MVDVSLNTVDDNEEDRDETLQPEVETQPIEPPPQIEPTEVTQPAPQREAGIEGLVQDPYKRGTALDQMRLREAFQYRPEVLGFTKEPLVPRGGQEYGDPIETPVGELDPITAEQERLLKQAKTFFTLDLEEVAFPENATPEQKYRTLIRNEGGYLPQLDDNGREVRTEGSLELFPLTTTREYERYTTPFQPENIVERAGELARSAVSVFTGPTGQGDLVELDKKLKEIGMDNQIARTLALRGVATGRYEADVVNQQLQDLGVFALSIPKMATELSSFLTTEVVMQAIDASITSNITDEEARSTVSQGFQVVSDFLDIASHVGLESTIEEMSGDIYNPDVIEEILAPRGIYQSVAAYAGPEAALYGVWGTFRAVSAARKIPALQKYMKETYGSEDLVEAFNTARQGGKSHTQVVQEYIETQTGDKAQRKLAKDLDIAFGMMVRRPGEARTEFLQSEYDRIGTSINSTLETIRAARRTGKTDVVKRQQKVLADLRRQKVNFMHRNLTPKYFRDLYGEAGMTVGATVAAQQTLQQFFGFKQSEMMPVEIASALSVAVPFGRFGTSADVAAATFRSSVRLYDELANFASAIDFKVGVIPTGFDTEGFVKGREDLRLSSQAMAVLRKVTEQPNEFQTMFMQGLQQHVDYRNRLVELSDRTGVEIDENLMVSNLAIMSNISELIDISRQLDEKLVATGFDDITGPIIERNEVIAGQQELITQLAMSTQKLLDVRLQANLTDDDPLAKLSDQMREFVLSEQKRLESDRAYIADIMKKNREALKASMAVDYIDGDQAVLETNRVLSETFTQEIEAIANNMSDDVRGLVLDPQEGVSQRLARIDELREQHFQMIAQINRGLRPAEAASGRAAGHFANVVAFRRSVIDGEVAKRYMEFDTQNPNVHANISDQFENFMGTNADLDIFNPDYVLEGANKLAGYKMVASDRKGFASLFNGAAKRGIEMMNRRSNGALGQALQDLELDGASPIQQWMELRRLAKEQPETLGMSADQAQAFAENIPLLVNTKEWRKVNKHLGKMIRTSSADGEKKNKYMGMYDQWQMVGKNTYDDGTPNRGAFMDGWLDGETPRPVGDEVYAQFRSIQDYYRTEVINRYTIDKQIKGWDSTLTGKTKGAAVGPTSAMDEVAEDELLQDFLRTFDQVDEAQMPVNWLNQLLVRVGKKSQEAGVPLSGDGVNGSLYLSISRALGKIGGVYDPDTGRYLLIDSSPLPEEKLVGEMTGQLRNLLTRHLQGILYRKDNSTLPRDAKGRISFEPNIPVEYDENMFKSLFNIPVYVRNEAGEVVPKIDEQGNPVMLLNEEEVFSGVDLNALERTRIDLRETFEEADTYVNNLEDDIIKNMTEVGPRGEPIGLEAVAKAEIQFAQDLQFELFGMRPNSSRMGITKEQADQNLYDSFIGRDGSQDLTRLRTRLVERGYSADFVDAAIAKSVNDHLIAKTRRYVGNKETVRADGVHLKKPQYEMSTAQILQMIGEPGSDTRRRLETIIGEDAVNSWEIIAETIRKSDPKPSDSGIDAHVSSMSLDSVLSRIYNINRGVVSVQWVATESIIRASRQHSGTLLRAMLKDKEVAAEILKIIETNKVPEYKVEPRWLRVLMSEVVMAEARNENAASDAFASGYYGITDFPEPPERRVQARPETPLSNIVDRNERLAAIDQIDDPRERARARLELMGVDDEEMPVEEQEQLTEVEQEFQRLGLSTDIFKTQQEQ